jgi:hypothetical protein
MSGAERHAEKGSHVGMQLPEQEADLSALSRVQFRNVWNLPPFPLHAHPDWDLDTGTNLPRHSLPAGRSGVRLLARARFYAPI